MAGQTLQNRVRQTRASADLSIEDLASMSGVSRTAIKDIELRGHAPTPTVQAKLAAALTVRVEDLFFWSEPEMQAAVR